MFLFTITYPLLSPLFLCSPWLLWILLIAIVFVLSASSALLFSAVFIFINNSVTFDKLGSINGLAMTLVSLTRSAELPVSVHRREWQWCIICPLHTVTIVTLTNNISERCDFSMSLLQP